MQSISLLRFGFVCLASLPLSAEVSLAQVKIVTVDLTRVVNQTSEAKKVRQELNKMTEDARKKLATRQQSVQALERQLKDAQVNEDSEQAERFRLEVKNLERMAKDSEEEIKNKFFQTNKRLTDAAIRVVELYAAENEIDLVLDINEKTRGPILFGAKRIDITEQIIRKMN